MDKAKSIAELDDDGSILFFTKTWFLDDGLGARGIAREADSCDLLISQGLADAIIERGFKGDKGIGFYSADRSFRPYRNQA